ncbi:hypothetical protein ACIBHY_28305 [Nonomuraea sp. NPDC050547]|uniref:hypothetical protein n=1 Tax=unclassified Nonomuraea TaxID=2593643 RepID=UPI00378B5B52
MDYPDRRFRLWVYVPTHSKLLLRSGRETSGTTTIDIAFAGVASLVETDEHGRRLRERDRWGIIPPESGWRSSPEP